MKKHTIHYILLLIILITGVLSTFNYYQKNKELGSYCDKSSFHFENTYIQGKKTRICVENRNSDFPLCEESLNLMEPVINCRQWK